MAEKLKNIHIAFKINEDQCKAFRALADYYSMGLNDVVRFLVLTILPEEIKKTGVVYDTNEPLRDVDRSKLVTTKFVSD